MIMILLSRVLKYRANRWTDIIAGISLSAVNAVTLFVGTPTLAYLFISIVSIGAGAAIVGYAWKWHAVSDAEWDQNQSVVLYDKSVCGGKQRLSKEGRSAGQFQRLINQP